MGQKNLKVVRWRAAESCHCENACFSDVILADEPTGKLDGKTQNAIMDIFIRLVKKQDKCIIIVTHSPEVAQMADMKYELSKNSK